jgi:hypothetical protein
MSIFLPVESRVGDNRHVPAINHGRNMKRIIALAVIGIASQTLTALAGPPETKQVIAPAPPPPLEYFRPNEFDIGVFGTWVDFTNSHRVTNGSIHGWGGGMDFTYWFPWKYAGVRFQGAGFELSGNGNQRTETVDVRGFGPVTATFGGGSRAAGVINADALLRLPLDDFWPGFHLAPYVFGGFGGFFAGGGGGEGRTINPQTFTVINNGTGATHQVTLTGQRIGRIRNNISSDRVLGRIGGGLEYRFTPNIGIFTEASYVFPNLSGNNFVQWNFFGLRYAF